jgi:hypothetical protein
MRSCHEMHSLKERVLIPLDLFSIKVRSFRPYMIPRQNKILLMITPEVSERSGPQEPQYFLIINLQNFQVYPCKCYCDMPISTLIFRKRNRFVAQNIFGIYECLINELPNGSYKMEQDPKGVKIDTNGSKLKAFAVTDKGVHGQILLVNEKRLGPRNVVKVFRVDMNKVRESLANEMPELSPSAASPETRTFKLENVVEIAALLNATNTAKQPIFSKTCELSISACHDETTDHIFVIAASDKFALFFETSVETLSPCNHVNFSNVLTIRSAKQIKVLNGLQLAVFSKYMVLVFRYGSNRIKKA